jgi:azurin
MAFTETALTAKAGLVRIRLKNNATVGAMVHNVVIVEMGQEDAVGRSSMASSVDKQWLPADGFLAASALAQPGGEATVVADLKPGEYSYICTFPGHYLVMRGVLTITE